MSSLKNQVAVITGASRGIGATIAEHCAAQGAVVCVMARNVDSLADVVNRICHSGGAARAFPADVTNQNHVRSAFCEIQDAHGRIDLLVNGAGRLNAIGPTWDVEPDDWWHDVTVNLRGAMLCCHEAIPAMIERDHGRIVNIVGGGTAGPFEFGSAYGCSKAALMRLTDTLAEELDGTSVYAFAVNPGFVRTRMTEQFLQTEPGRRWMSRLAQRLREGADVAPDHAARLVVEIAAGRCDVLRGRYLYAPDDARRLDELVAQAQAPLQGDTRTLRVV